MTTHFVTFMFRIGFGFVGFLSGLGVWTWLGVTLFSDSWFWWNIHKWSWILPTGLFISLLLMTLDLAVTSMLFYVSWISIAYAIFGEMEP